MKTAPSKFSRKISAADREAIGATRATRPRITDAEARALAEEYGISKKWAQELRTQYARKHELKRPPRPLTLRLTTEQRLEIQELLRLRRTLSDKGLARRFGVTPWQIRHVARVKLNTPAARHIGAGSSAATSQRRAFATPPAPLPAAVFSSEGQP